MSETATAQSPGHLHVVGAGGIGVSAIARYYAQMGWTVSGSNDSDSTVAEGLRKEGIPVAIGHAAENVPENTTLLVYSEAVITKPDLPKEEQVFSNPEILLARERHIRRLSYPEALAELFNHKRGIAVTGSHGKSTTTAMIGTALLESGAGGSTVVGTTVPQFDGRNGHFEPENDRFAIEACEYRRSFLRYLPEIAVVTNIDLDHLDYYKDLEDYRSAFEEFLSHTRRAAVFSTDCENSRIVAASPKLAHLEKYFVSEDGYVGPDGIVKPFPKMDLQVPGDHLAQDARLAYVALLLSGVPEGRIAPALQKYRGSWRRSEIVGTTQNGNLVMSDYGHHPSEIRPTLTAIKAKYPDKTLFTVFQPHQHSRTRELLDEFATAFDGTDELLVPDIYFSRDKKEDVEWMTVGRLIDTLRKRYPKVRGGEGLDAALRDILEFDRANPGKAVILLLGAGTVDDLRYKIPLRA
jgi:UDP-N-acetylmuramate--alanine ligase